MEQNMQQICNEMDKNAYEFLEFQRAYHTDKANDQVLMERTTQPFWQSMRLSKRRLASKGLSMDVEIEGDKKSKTIEDERLHMRKDGHHLAGNKTLDVIAHRTFYRDGKKIFSIKNREICNLALLKTEVNGDQAACPNCGYVNTITSFIDGCDACDSKFTVQDFETKVSGFSLEENTSAKIKSTVAGNAKLLGALIAAFILLGIVALIFVAVRMYMGIEGVNMVDVILSLYTSIVMVPVTIKSIIILGIVYAVGASYLVSIYKKPILQEEIVKQILPDFSARDFYQNLEYKLRNIHLTDRAEEVNVFARCALNDIIPGYKNVVECDMTRLKFIDIQTDLDGYRLNVESELRLTECDEKRISTNYEKLNLTLFGKPEVIGKSVTTLRQYSCPGCRASINILEGGVCNYCGNTFDYSEFGWVIEAYENKRQPVSLYQFIKYAMIGLFILVFGGHILLPSGIGNPSIFTMRQEFSEQMKSIENIYTSVQTPDALYEDVNCITSNDIILEQVATYRAKDAKAITEQYQSYLTSQGLQFYKMLDYGFVVYTSFYLDTEETIQYYYRISVTYEGNDLTVEEEIVEDLEEVVDPLE